MKVNDLFEQPLKVINVGLIDFFETLVKCGVEARHVELTEGGTTEKAGETSDASQGKTSWKN